ncbi:MAG: VanZ family protein [Cryomorphaceae bacterium]|nr:VanZ family protein [Flavobacteriales bacterium]
MKAFFKTYRAALIWAAFILLLCGIPGKDLPNIDIWDINIEDKLAHMGVFGVLAFLAVWSMYRNPGTAVSIKNLIFLATLGAAYGGLTELLQGWLFPSRFASISDFIADAIGMVLGTLFANWYFSKQSNQ